MKASTYNMILIPLLVCTGLCGILASGCLFIYAYPAFLLFGSLTLLVPVVLMALGKEIEE